LREKGEKNVHRASAGLEGMRIVRSQILPPWLLSSLVMFAVRYFSLLKGKKGDFEKERVAEAAD